MKVIYQADDGTIFNNADACLWYDNLPEAGAPCPKTGFWAPYNHTRQLAEWLALNAIPRNNYEAIRSGEGCQSSGEAQPLNANLRTSKDW